MFHGSVFSKISDKIIDIKGEENDFGSWIMMNYMRRRPYLYPELYELDKFDSFYFTKKNDLSSNRYLYAKIGNKYINYTLNFEVPETSMIYSEIERIEVSKEQYFSKYKEVLRDTSFVLFKIEVRGKGKTIRVNN